MVIVSGWCSDYMVEVSLLINIWLWLFLEKLNAIKLPKNKKIYCKYNSIKGEIVINCNNSVSESEQEF